MTTCTDKVVRTLIIILARRAHPTETDAARAAVDVEASFFPRMNDRRQARPRSSVAIGGHSFGQYWALALAAAAFR